MNIIYAMSVKFHKCGDSWTQKKLCTLLSVRRRLSVSTTDLEINTVNIDHESCLISEMLYIIVER